MDVKRLFRVLGVNYEETVNEYFDDLESSVRVGDYGAFERLALELFKKTKFDVWVKKTVAEILPPELRLNVDSVHVEPRRNIQNSKNFVGKNISGVWVHIVQIPNYGDSVVESLTRTIEVDGQVCMSDFVQGSWLGWGYDTVALIYRGVADVVFNHDVYSYMLPDGTREIPTLEELGDADPAIDIRVEAWVNPQKAKLVGFIVHPNIDPTAKDAVVRVAKSLRVSVNVDTNEKFGRQKTPIELPRNLSEDQKKQYTEILQKEFPYSRSKLDGNIYVSQSYGSICNTLVHVKGPNVAISTLLQLKQNPELLKYDIVVPQLIIAGYDIEDIKYVTSALSNGVNHAIQGEQYIIPLLVKQYPLSKDGLVDFLNKMGTYTCTSTYSTRTMIDNYRVEFQKYYSNDVERTKLLDDIERICTRTVRNAGPSDISQFHADTYGIFDGMTVILSNVGGALLLSFNPTEDFRTVNKRLRTVLKVEKSNTEQMGEYDIYTILIYKMNEQGAPGGFAHYLIKNVVDDIKQQFKIDLSEHSAEIDYDIVREIDELMNQYVSKWYEYVPYDVFPEAIDKWKKEHGVS